MKKAFIFFFCLTILFISTPKFIAESNHLIDEDVLSDVILDEYENEYSLSTNISIKYGATLKVTNGSTLYGNGNTIHVFGTLIIDNANINNLKIDANNTDTKPCSVIIKNSNYYGGRLFPPTGNSSHANILIENNHFKNLNGYSYILYPSSELYITKNVFESCSGFSIGSDYNVFFINNVFHGINTPYCIESWAQYHSNCFVEKNSFYISGTVLKLSIDGKMIAKNNYWNTTDENEIKSKIIDGNVDFTMSRTIDFSDFLSEPDTETPQMNHTLKCTNIIVPNCSESGQKINKCIYCDYYEKETIPINSNNHIMNYQSNNDATCTKDGTKTAVCEKCGFTNTITDIGSAKGHDYYDVVKSPSCNEKGYTTHICSVCGNNYVDTYVNLLGHNFCEWTTFSEATCTQNGSETRHCFRCGEIETREIEADGHKLTDWIVVNEPTCSEKGIKIKICLNCGILIDKTDINTTPHIFGDEWETIKEPTDTEEGIEVLKCTKCGEVLQTRSIPKLKQGRVYSVKINDISLNYKKSTTLKPAIEADNGVKYTVKYESSNPKVATVDQNGNVTATKRGSGSATITCTVTDQYGNVVKDTCKVNVSLTFGQKIIVYVLFGWIWY